MALLYRLLVTDEQSRGPSIFRGTQRPFSVKHLFGEANFA